MTLIDDIRAEMTSNGNTPIFFGDELKKRVSGRQTVLVSRDAKGFHIDYNTGADATVILWLPWEQGEITELQPPPPNIANGTLFFTFYLTGCKVFAIQGGPVFHIDAPVTAIDCWGQILKSDWVIENWVAGEAQAVAYVHRDQQRPELWDLSAVLAGKAPVTYGEDDVGEAIVGGIVNGNEKWLDLYMQASPWAKFVYQAQTLMKK